MKRNNIIIIAVLVLVLLVGLGQYNSIIGKREDVKNAWAQVDNQLQRRNDLIPNYVSTVKGYAKHEKEIFEKIAEARSKMAGAGTVGEKIAADQGLTSAISRLMVIVENYPNLKADANFRSLQDELAGTENRIAVERKRYNDTVNIYNKKILMFPGNLYAGIFGFKSAEFFQVEEKAKTVPKVEF